MPRNSQLLFSVTDHVAGFGNKLLITLKILSHTITDIKTNEASSSGIEPEPRK